MGSYAERFQQGPGGSRAADKAKTSYAVNILETTLEIQTIVERFSGYEAGRSRELSVK